MERKSKISPQVATVTLRIRDIRLSMGLNQTEFAAIAKTYACEISDWEAGKRLPSLATLASIAVNLKMKLDDLVIIKTKSSA
jgi:transcriptional regulator with XRE-family HTH domain